jgi:Ca-activated chloride channel family protein
LRIGERLIEGEIKEKQQAIATYQAARAAGQRTSLVTQQRPNLFTTRVANVGPGEEITVSIGYVQKLDYVDGSFSLRFPMTVTPRYGGSSSATDGLYPDEIEADPTQAVRKAAGLTANPISMSIHLNPGFDLVHLESRYHDIDIAESNGLYLIELADGQTPADRDFELVWEPTLKGTPRAAVFTEAHGGDQYAMIMVMPPQDDQPISQPRELILVIDTAGSMQGASIRQARDSLLMAIGTLLPDDRFNVIQFNSSADALFSTPVTASDNALLKADQWIRGLGANGGTEMAPALELALQGQAPQGYVRQVVFVTDGSVGNEVELFQLIEDRLGDTRLFTVGIGAAPNGYFMRKAAEFGRGSFTYIGSTAEVAEKMDALLRRLETPALTDICVNWPTVAEVYPRELPDLYLGEPLVVTARLERLKGDVELCGDNGRKAWNEWLPLETEEPGAGVATLWARRKISGLMDELALGGDAMVVRDQVLDVALEHRLVSRYTAFVAVDKTPARSQQALRSARLANLAPADSAFGDLPMSLPQGGTDAMLRLCLGLALLFMAWVFSVRLRDDAF